MEVREGFVELCWSLLLRMWQHLHGLGFHSKAGLWPVREDGLAVGFPCHQGNIISEFGLDQESANCSLLMFVNKVFLEHSQLLHCVLSVASKQTSKTGPKWPTSPYIFTLWPFKETFADSWFRLMMMGMENVVMTNMTVRVMMVVVTSMDGGDDGDGDDGDGDDGDRILMM